MKLYAGSQLKHYEGEIYTICFACSLRGKYFYVIKDSKGGKSTVGRKSMIEALNNKIFELWTK